MAIIKTESLYTAADRARIRINYFDVDSGKKGPVLLVTAAIHGNEVQGTEVIRRFVTTAGENLVKGKLLLVPFANAPAVWNRRPHVNSTPCKPYTSPDNDDMNHLFPGTPGESISSHLAFLLRKHLAESSTHLVDIHCWEKFRAPGVIVTKGHDSSLEFGKSTGLRLIRTSGLEAEEHAGFLKPCSLRHWFVANGKCAIAIELSGQYSIDEKQVATGLMVLKNCCGFLEMFDQEPKLGSEKVYILDEDYEGVKVEAPLDGMFTAAAIRPGDCVRKGDLLGVIFSDRNLKSTPVFSPAAGYLCQYGIRRENSDVDLASWHPYALKGDILAVIVNS